MGQSLYPQELAWEVRLQWQQHQSMDGTLRVRLRDGGNVAVPGARGRVVILDQWNQRKHGNGGNGAFELNCKG